MMHLALSPLSLSLSLAFSSLTSASGTFDCHHVRLEKKSYDFSELKGPHYVHWVRRAPPMIANTTYTVDLCEGMTRKSGDKKEDHCPNGTRVCAITQKYHEDDEYDPDARPEEVRTIAGSFALDSGRLLEPEWTLLRNSDSNADSQKDGLRLEMHGGSYPDPDNPDSELKQKVIIEFICNMTRTGLEGQPGADGKKLAAVARTEEEEDDDDGGGDDSRQLPDPDAGHSLTFEGFKEKGVGSEKEEMGILRLEWQTKHACEGQSSHDDNSTSSGGGWGFFTWLIIIVFMTVAAYLIFGSWLNYNRHGARGWDLLPHGDTLRDIPYLIKDWTRRVLGTVQSGGSRDLGYIRV